MELMIYRLALFLTAIINLIMAGMLWNGSKAYKKYAIYYRTRLLTTLWIAVFGLGYLIHGTFMWRFSWPTAASALTVSYFHIGAICFSWGYTSLLNPNYLTRRIVWRDTLIFLFALIVYWMVAALWHEAPGFTLLSYVIFFGINYRNVMMIIALVIIERKYEPIFMKGSKVLHKNNQKFDNDGHIEFTEDNIDWWITVLV